MRKFFYFSMLLIIFGVQNSAIAQTTIYVNVNATGANNGTTPADAYTSITAALADAAVTGTSDTVLIAEGTYLEGAALTLVTSTTIMGGYNAAFTARDAISSPTVISGNNTHVVMSASNVTQVVIDGVTVSDARIAAAGNRGAGLTAVNSEIGIVDSTFDNNTAKASGADQNTGSRGGAIGLTGGCSLTVAACDFTSNSGTRGGAVSISGGGNLTTFTFCLFSENKALVSPPGNNARGGAFMIDDGNNYTDTLFLIDCVIDSNTTDGDSSVLFDDASGLISFDRCEITNNAQVGTGGGGDGSLIRASDPGSGRMEFLNCVIANNTSTASNLTRLGPIEIIMQHCTVYGNVSAGNNAIFRIDDAPVVANEVFDCRNNVFISNSAVAGGQELIQIDEPAGSPGIVIENNIFAENDISAFDDEGIIVLGTAGNENGVTAANVLEDGPGGDYHLSSGSITNPAIQGGQDLGFAFDIEGTARPSPVVSNPDAGAFESLAPHTIYVNVAAAGANNGTSPADAYTSFASALTEAAGNANPDEILIAGGTYTEGAAFVLNSGLSIQGGYNAAFTVIDLLGTPTILDGAQSHPVMTGNGVTGIALSGIIIYNGKLLASGNDGAGLSLNDNCQVDLIDCVIFNNNGKASFTDNSTGSTGGGIFMDDNNTVTLTDCAITSNSSVRGGGIMVAGTGSVCSLSNCILSENRAIGGGGTTARGGAIGTDDGNAATAQVTLVNCQITSNTTDGNGAVLWDGAVGSISFQKCTITGNSQFVGGGGNSDGGIIQCDEPVSIAIESINSIWSNNTGGNSGQFARLDPINVTFHHNTFYGNTSGSNDIFRLNAVAGLPADEVVDVRNNIFAANDAEGGTEGLFVFDGGTTSATITIANNLMAENNLSQFDSLGLITASNNRLGYLVADTFVDAANGDLHLLNAPLTNGALGYGQDLGYTDDLEGNVRPNPALSNPDVGAYESSAVPVELSIFSIE